MNGIKIVDEAKSKKKKRTYKWLVFFIVCIVFWLYNNFTLKTTYINIEYENVHDKLKLVVLSDYHAEKYGISNNAIINAIQKENPDLIFALGDMYSNRENDNREIPISLLSQLVMKDYDVYFVPGEHDNDESYLDELTENGINVMNYKAESITIKSTGITIYGIDNAYFSDTFDLSNEFEAPDSNTFSVLLAHIPMYDYYKKFGTDLTLCGDTHGEVIRLPAIGPVYADGQFFPYIANNQQPIYDKGLFEYEGGYMFITSGIGNYPFPLRMFNRPEIVCITIAPEEN